MKKIQIIRLARKAGSQGFTTRPIARKIGCSEEHVRKTVMDAGARKGKYRRDGQDILFLN